MYSRSSDLIRSVSEGGLLPQRVWGSRPPSGKYQTDPPEYQLWGQLFAGNAL